MKKRPETAQRGDQKQLAFFASLQNSEGLNFIRLGFSERLKIKLINNGWDSFLTQKSSNESRNARITIDFSNVGGHIDIKQPPRPIAGFSLSTSENNLVFTFEQQVTFWGWLSDDSIDVVFPEIVVTGTSGLGTIRAKVENIEHALSATMDVAVFRLKMEGESGYFAANWKYDNTVNTVGTLVDDGGGVLKLIINNADGFIRPEMAGDEQPEFFFMLSDGYSQGYSALVPPEQATKINVEVAENEPWRVTTDNNTAYPVWEIQYDPAKHPSSGDIQIKMNNIQSLESSSGNAQLLLYFTKVPGVADSYQVLNARMETAAVESSGGLQILAFTVDGSDTGITLNNINAPTQVLLSWNVQSAGYVTLSGRGLVDAQVNNMNVDVEQTTVFTLTAFSASLAQAVSKNVTVTVKPDLLTRVIPKGTITVWSGSKETIPDGWALCDGKNGTPNLQDKFIMGAGGSQQPGANGPASTHTHNVAPPSVAFTSTTNGNHSHGMPSNWYARNLSCGKWSGIDAGSNAYAHTQDAGNHNHSVTVAIPQFTSGPNDNTVLPPWFALCYIQKMGV